MWTVENRKRYERSHLRYPKRFDRRRMAAHRASDPCCETRRAKAHSKHTRSHQRSHAWAFDRMPVAIPTQGSTAEKHRVPLLRFVEP